jgi:exonuclease III
LAKCIKKEGPTICCLQETHLVDKNKHWLRVKGWKKIYQANGSPKQAGRAILISDKVDFTLTFVKRDKEGHFILIKGAIHQEEITIIILYAPKVSAPNFIKQIKGLKTVYIDYNTVVVGDFAIPLLPICMSSRQKINKEILQLNDTIDLMELKDVYRIFHLVTAKYACSQQSNFLQKRPCFRAQSKSQQI